MRVVILSLLLLACGRTLLLVPGDAPPPPDGGAGGVGGGRAGGAPGGGSGTGGGSVQPGACRLMVTELIDFGVVPLGEAALRTIVLINLGDGDCVLDDVALAPTGDFTLPLPPPARLPPQMPLVMRLGFQTQTATPVTRTAMLTFSINEPNRTRVHIAVRARVGRCELSAQPALVTFMPVRPGQTDVRNVTLVNDGEARCDLTDWALGGDPGFSGVDTLPNSIPPGSAVRVAIIFTGDDAAPSRRTGQLRVRATTETQPLVVLLEARSMICEWVATPNPFDFGNVMLNTTTTAALTFKNDGLDTCTISGFTLTGSSLFSLVAAPPSLILSPGGTGQVPIRFAAFDSAPPHQRSATLTFSANQLGRMSSVPVRGFISTVCNQHGQFIYTVDRNGTFSRFDPSALTSTTVGTLACMNTTLPFSMNLDQNATAWVVFDDGRLHKVDVTNAACSSTTYMPGGNGFTGFGMGSVFDSTTGVDTLYIAGGPTFRSLGKLDLTTLTTSVITNNLPLQSVELAGTGDGQLWAFQPRGLGPSGGPPILARLEPTDGGVMSQHPLPAVTSNGGYAVKFWGGAFYIFIGADVWKVPRATLVPQLVFSRPGLEVVGAGVSTCAPVMGP